MDPEQAATAIGNAVMEALEGCLHKRPAQADAILQIALALQGTLAKAATEAPPPLQQSYYALLGQLAQLASRSSDTADKVRDARLSRLQNELLADPKP